MKKHIEFQTRRILSTNGGAGSIIESINGALKVEPFDKWDYFQAKFHQKEENLIVDDRLLDRLKQHFSELIGLVKIPISQKKDNYVNAIYFPEWMFCKNCERFKHISEWFEKWKNTLAYYKQSYDDIRASFHPPRCSYCYEDAKKNKKKNNYHELEQVRFIMTSPSGEIRDVPWSEWPTADKSFKESKSKELEETNTEAEYKDEDAYEKIKLNGICCNNQDLRYITSKKFADLVGIRIECKNCGRKNNLAGIFNLRLIDPTDKSRKSFFKVVIRTSHSVYYAQTINGIYLPLFAEFLEISNDHKKMIDKLKEKGQDISSIIELLQELNNNYSKQQIENYIKGETNKPFFLSEEEFRKREYDFFITEQSPFQDLQNDLTFERFELRDPKEFFNLKYFTKIDRLKVTTVQTSYTRQDPVDKDYYLKDDEENIRIKRKYTSTQGKYTKYLPAIENFGEGIFLAFDKKAINDWVNRCLKDNDFKVNRIEKIQKNDKERDFNLNPNRFNNPKFLAKFILIHTFAHLLIKELEYLCGYPAISLTERLYINENEMQGILIYTVAGTESSYGGLISLASLEKFSRIIKSALIRARDCNSDPVCFNSEGQGVANLNLAACYSCALLPEPSCEEFNSYLDRRFLIDNNFGFFKFS